MTTNILSSKWEGDTAAPIDPTAIGFKAAPAPVIDDCTGCIFLGQRNAVCRQACAIAVENGQIDCDEPWPEGGSVIYVIADKRQLDLLKDGQPDECESSSGLAKSTRGRVG
jgi:hypothetical protein